jgi:signal transduction histidine kinase
VVRDVTERKRAEEQIRTLNQQLVEANKGLELQNREVEKATRLKDEFLASMSHELRTPLNAIIGFSDLLAEQGAVQFSSKQKRFVGHIQQGARHLLELINDILDLSKIEAGRLELKYEDFNVSAAAAEILATVRPMATAKNLQIANTVPDGLFLYADRLRFKQVLYNLLSNAIKFTAGGGYVSFETCSRQWRGMLLRRGYRNWYSEGRARSHIPHFSSSRDHHKGRARGHWLGLGDYQEIGRAAWRQDLGG